MDPTNKNAICHQLLYEQNDNRNNDFEVVMPQFFNLDIDWRIERKDDAPPFMPWKIQATKYWSI